MMQNHDCTELGRWIWQKIYFVARAAMGWKFSKISALLLIISWTLGAATAQTATIGGRYQVSTAGDEVTDTQTGLIWQRCAVGQMAGAGKCSGVGTNYSWDDAMKFAAGQQAQGWRVPAIRELASLLKCSFAQMKDSDNPDGQGAMRHNCELPGNTSPIPIHEDAFPNFEGLYYWSATTDAKISDEAWGINFEESGRAFPDKKNTPADNTRVLLVRGTGRLPIAPAITDPTPASISQQAAKPAKSANKPALVAAKPSLTATAKPNTPSKVAPPPASAGAAAKVLRVVEATETRNQGTTPADDTLTAAVPNDPQPGTTDPPPPDEPSAQSAAPEKPNKPTGTPMSSPTAASGRPAVMTASCTTWKNGQAVRVPMTGYPQKFLGMVLDVSSRSISVRIADPTAPDSVKGRLITMSCEKLALNN